MSPDGPVPYPGYHQQGLVAPPQYNELYPSKLHDALIITALSLDTPSRAPQRPPSPPPVASSDPEKGAPCGAGPPPAPPAVSRSQLRVGLKLEADDRRFPYYVCVATIDDMRSELYNK